MSYKVLLCDDEIHVLRAAEVKVRRAGYDVRIAGNGLEAWEMIQADRPDLLVTDVQMPMVDGLELVRRIRENPATKDLPILMLTAKGFELEHDELIQDWGVAGIVSKPFSPRELVEEIDHALENLPHAAR